MNQKNLVVINKKDALEIFTGEKLDDFLKKIKNNVLNFVPCLDTVAGRKQIASKAHEVAKHKIQIDNIGKELVADWKRKAKIVDESRKKTRDFLDDLKKEVRQPLTNWEISEVKKIEAKRLADEISLAHEGALIENELIDRQTAIKNKEDELKAQEKARIEQERLAIEKQERLEREKQIALEAKLKAEREAIEKIEAEKRAKIESELKAKHDAEEIAKRVEFEKLIAIEKAEIEKREAVERERKRLADIEFAKTEKELEEKRIADRKAANISHQRKTNKESLQCFINEGFQENDAKNIITLIAKNKIKNITINY